MNPAPPRFGWESYTQLRVADGPTESLHGAVRRLRLNLFGQPDPDSRWLVQVFYKDGNRSATDGRIWLQDISWRRRVGHSAWTLGQFRPSFGLERLTGDRDLILLERAVVSDAIMPAGGMNGSFARDIGVQWETSARGNTLFLGLFRGSGAALQGGVGTGGPLLAARALHTERGWQIGGAVTVRENDHRDFSRAFPGTRTLGMDRFHGRDTRFGLEATGQSGPWRGSAEWATVHFSGQGTSPHLNARGGYVTLARQVTPSVTTALGAQFFDPNIAVVDRNDLSAVTLGVSLAPPRRRERYHANYVFRRQRREDRPDDVLQIQYQVFLSP